MIAEPRIKRWLLRLLHLTGTAEPRRRCYAEEPRWANQTPAGRRNCWRQILPVADRREISTSAIKSWNKPCIPVTAGTEARPFAVMVAAPNCGFRVALLFSLQTCWRVFWRELRTGCICAAAGASRQASRVSGVQEDGATRCCGDTVVYSPHKERGSLAKIALCQRGVLQLAAPASIVLC